VTLFGFTFTGFAALSAGWLAVSFAAGSGVDATAVSVDAVGVEPESVMLPSSLAAAGSNPGC
jgi:hypothetical protein